MHLAVDSHFKDIVSLGTHCQPAFQIRRIFQIERAHVFDWAITPHSALIGLIRSEFHEFFSRERLRVGVKKRFVDAQYGMQFIHDFPEGGSFEGLYPGLHSKYKELVSRWQALMREDGPILFVRQQSDRASYRDEAREIVAAIEEKAPHLEFSLLYIGKSSTGQESSWQEGRTIGRTIQNPPDSGWEGDNQEWERLLGVRRL